MRVSYRWLCEFLPNIDVAPELVAERLTAAGLEVESVQHAGVELEALKVAVVKNIEPHPQRSNLTLVTVHHGTGDERVVCGAPNVPAPGGLVVFAPVGARLPGQERALEPKTIGGVPSAGMLCSEAELGLGDDAAGILILDAGRARAGMPFTQAIPEASDTILEVNLTPNRPDALGHIGIAREVSVLFATELRAPEAPKLATVPPRELSELVTIENEAPERCPHYGAAALVDVKIGPSPLSIRTRLHRLGVRPISNVVDVTNLMLLGYAQPMHAFDLDHIRGNRIIVRQARGGEPFTTLDGVLRTLDADDLVICDAAGPVALAGVMGGENSEIQASTRRVLLECAYFMPRGVRRTSRRHGLASESSHRFERGVDWGAIPVSLARAAAWIVELTGARSIDGAWHVKGKLPEVPRIRLRSVRLDALLGSHVPFEEARNILERLGLGVEDAPGDDARVVCFVNGASWRPDIAREVDLIDEVARIRGLDEIPTIIPAIRRRPPRVSGKLEREISVQAVNLGLSEALPFAFLSSRDLERVCAPRPSVTLQNPLSEERNVMRTSLLPGLLDALRHARRHAESAVRLFTVGAVFLPPSREEPSAAAARARPRLASDVGVLPDERPMFAALLAGPRPGYLEKPAEVDIFDAKGVACELVARVTGRDADVARANESLGLAYLHPRGRAELQIAGSVVGTFGSLHPEVIDAFDLGGAALAIEIDLSALEIWGKKAPSYRTIPRVPAVTRDIALVLHDDIAAARVEAVIRRAAGELCESIELFDLFRGAGIPDEHRSLAYHVVYRDPHARLGLANARTLTDEEVDRRHREVIRAVTEELGAALRA